MIRLLAMLTRRLHTLHDPPPPTQSTQSCTRSPFLTAPVHLPICEIDELPEQTLIYMCLE